jgi:hypothetical protein
MCDFCPDLKNTESAVVLGQVFFFCFSIFLICDSIPTFWDQKNRVTIAFSFNLDIQLVYNSF